LVVGPLFRRGVFFFGRGIGNDVLRDLFGADNILWQQVETEIRER
jgi:hypothetical protein